MYTLKTNNYLGSKTQVWATGADSSRMVYLGLLLMEDDFYDVYVTDETGRVVWHNGKVTV